jgi:ionotropic glutamate receptor NMDA 3A
MEYINYGFVDQLQSKWLGRAPCLSPIRGPEPLSIFSIGGAFILLLVGIFVGLLILSCEHLVFKYSLPKLRKKSKNSFWKNKKLMFFSQKMYRFVNTVEGVSSYYSIKDGDSVDSEGKTSRKSLKTTDVKALEARRSSF